MFPYSSLTTATAGIPEPIRELANAVRNTLCQVVPPAKWASEFVTQASGTPNLYPWLADAVCNLPGDPARPSRGQPSGGTAPNCQGQRYNVSYRTKSGGLGTQTGTVNALWGEIGKVIQPDPARPGRSQAFITHYGQGGDNPVATVQATRILADENVTEFVLTNVAPDPLKPFAPCKRPTVPHIAPDSIPPAPIPPVTLPPSWNLPNVSLPVTVRPVEIKPNVEFRPEINVDVGGINIRFGFDGWDFSISPTFSAPITVIPIPFLPPAPNLPTIGPSNPSPVNSPSGSDSSSCPDVNLQPVLDAVDLVNDAVIDNNTILKQNRDRIVSIKNVTDTIPERFDDLEDCICPPDTELVTTVPDVDSFDLDFGVELSHVELVLNSEGINNKVQDGKEAPNVIYAGWFAFGRATGLTPRSPIHYRNNYLLPPERELTRFSFTCYVGFKATIKVFRRKVNGV